MASALTRLSGHFVVREGRPEVVPEEDHQIGVGLEWFPHESDRRQMGIAGIEDVEPVGHPREGVGRKDLVLEIEQDGNDQVATEGEEEDDAPFADIRRRRGLRSSGAMGGSWLRPMGRRRCGRGSSTRTLASSRVRVELVTCSITSASLQLRTLRQGASHPMVQGHLESQLALRLVHVESEASRGV